MNEKEIKRERKKKRSETECEIWEFFALAISTLT